jgi:hypothetical protein
LPASDACIQFLEMLKAFQANCNGMRNEVKKRKGEIK